MGFYTSASIYCTSCGKVMHTADGEQAQCERWYKLCFARDFGLCSYFKLKVHSVPIFNWVTILSFSKYWQNLFQTYKNAAIAIECLEVSLFSTLSRPCLERSVVFHRRLLSIKLLILSVWVAKCFLLLSLLLIMVVVLFCWMSLHVPWAPLPRIFVLRSQQARDNWPSMSHFKHLTLVVLGSDYSNCSLLE